MRGPLKWGGQWGLVNDARRKRRLVDCVPPVHSFLRWSSVRTGLLEKEPGERLLVEREEHPDADPE